MVMKFGLLLWGKKKLQIGPFENKGFRKMFGHKSDEVNGKLRTGHYVTYADHHYVTYADHHELSVKWSKRDYVLLETGSDGEGRNVNRILVGKHLAKRSLWCEVDWTGSGSRQMASFGTGGVKLESWLVLRVFVT